MIELYEMTIFTIGLTFFPRSVSAKVNVPTASATRTIMLNNMFNPTEYVYWRYPSVSVT